MGNFFAFVYHQLSFTPQPLPAETPLEGKTAIVTGANSGLGFEAARELASHQLSRLIIAVRDVEKGNSARETISKENPKCEIEVWQVDYEAYDSIIAFGNRAAQLTQLDYVLLNAGVKMLEYTTSHTGHELNVQINHLGTSLVSLLLLPILQKTADATGQPSRMTIVSSEGHFWIPFHERKASNILARMDEKSTFGTAMQRYYTTKLLNVLWTRELASRIPKTQVIINNVNPGFCYSGLHRHDHGQGYKFFLRLMGWTSTQGGHCLTDALVNHDGSHAAYFSEQKETPPSSFVTSTEGQAAQRQIWNETLTLLKQEAPEAKLPAFAT